MSTRSKKFTKKAFAAAIAKRCPDLTEDLALTALNAMDDIIAEELKNAPVYLDNIGTFKRVEVKATRKNIIVGKGQHEVRDIPAHVKVRLTPSKTLIKRAQ